MAVRRSWKDEFFGGGASFQVPTTAVWYSPWKNTFTAAAGTPPCTFGNDNGALEDAAGIMKLGHTSTNQVENNCLSWGDILSFGLDKRPVWKSRIRLGQASLDSTTSLFFGLTGDRADAIASITVRVGFVMVSSVSSTIVYVVTDDGVTDSGNVSTTIALGTGWKDFEIDARAKSNILFYMTDNDNRRTRVGQGTTFSMAAYSGSLQPNYQIQKTADTNVDYLNADSVEMEWDI